MSGRRRRRGAGFVAGWAGVTGVCALIAAVTQSLVWLIVAVLSLAVTLVALLLGSRISVPVVPAQTATTRKTRKRGVSATSGVRGGQPARQGWAVQSSLGKTQCTARCRMSTKDRSLCTCECGGTTHGKYRRRGRE